MDRILAEVLCPATSKKYEFWISKKMLNKDVKLRVTEEISNYEMNEYLFCNIENIYLLDANTNELLNDEWSIEDSGLKSGDLLVLI